MAPTLHYIKKSVLDELYMLKEEEENTSILV